MVGHSNHVIPGPDLHYAGPMALWGFLQHLSAKCRKKQKKTNNTIRARVPGTVRYGKSGSSYCITFIKRLNEGLR